MADDANRRVKANAHNQEMSDKKNHEALATKMAEDITALKKRLAELVAENKEKEQTLRKVRGALKESLAIDQISPGPFLPWDISLSWQTNFMSFWRTTV